MLLVTRHPFPFVEASCPNVDVRKRVRGGFLSRFSNPSNIEVAAQLAVQLDGSCQTFPARVCIVCGNGFTKRSDPCRKTGLKMAQAAAITAVDDCCQRRQDPCANFLESIDSLEQLSMRHLKCISVYSGPEF